MKPPSLRYLYFIGLLLIIVSLSCTTFNRLSGEAEEPLPANPSVEPSEEMPVADTPVPEIPSPTSEEVETSPEAPPSPDATIPPAEAGPCAEEVCVNDGYFLLKRPISPDGRNTIVYTDRFGSYRSATRDALRGVYFLNSSGTPVLASADGEVVVAGDDSQRPYGPFLNLYGNLVILKHDLSGFSQPLFTLYAHLSEISVEVGDTVTAGDEIGLVGMSGDVSGSTLLFEVRLGENHPDAAHNPELWLEPLSDDTGQLQGALAGRVIDSHGKLLDISNIVVERLAGPGLPAIDQIYLKTYAEKSLMGLDPWAENFAAGDLPAGEYQISFYHEGDLQQRVVEVQPGKLTLVIFELK
ncbi:MAG TPA: peptidoglycan DD-metalloendopeptidase family protein [Anaerolineales bacterium]|nr:peptidoglycan DD-metalloendopeptidase family protein [Anaerolineales bacterium]